MLRGFAVFLLSLAMLGAGCVSHGKPASRGTARLALKADNKVSEMKLKYEYVLELTLPPTTPEYRWEISFHDPRYLVLQKDIQPGTADHGPTVSFFGAMPGQTRLRFVLLPAQAGRTLDPIDQQELIVRIE